MGLTTGGDGVFPPTLQHRGPQPRCVPVSLTNDIGPKARRKMGLRTCFGGGGSDTTGGVVQFKASRSPAPRLSAVASAPSQPCCRGGPVWAPQATPRVVRPPPAAWPRGRGAADGGRGRGRVMHWPPPPRNPHLLSAGTGAASPRRQFPGRDPDTFAGTTNSPPPSLPSGAASHEAATQ